MNHEPLAVTPEDEWNRRLVANVRPTDWANPTPAPRYNLVVIGGGTAGLVSAAGAAGLGAKVALIERDLLGGDCLNVGCVPSKALIRAAHAVADVRRAADFGIHVPQGVHVDFSAVMERLRRLRASLSVHDSAERFRSLGVDVFQGEGRFTGPDTIAVAGQTLRFRRAVIATGARAARPEIPGLREAGCLTNESIFNLTELPRRLAVIGGGPIGCELAQAFARLGSAVTLLGKAPTLLPREDADAASLLADALQRDGVQCHLEVAIERIECLANEKRIHLRANERRGLSPPIAADAILVATGRQPNVEHLDLEAAGIAFDRHGVHVDDRLRSTNRRVYAAGDVCSRFQFTHAADAMARIVIQNALFLGRAKASALTIPWCTYTDPEVAHVGLSERDAAERGIAIDTHRIEMSRVDRAVLDGDDVGFVKVHCKQGTDRIVGTTVVARRAGDMIAEITLAMTAGLGLKAIGRTIHPYPTQIEAVKKAADAYNRTRLTPFVKRLLGWWLATRR